jgi:hypothetical protein
LSTILTPPTGGFSASLSNNTLTISYNGAEGTATESSVTVQGSISANGQTIQVTQTLSLKINRLGQAQLSLMNGLASLLVGGTVYDSNGTARTFESGIQTSKTNGFIGTMVNGLAAAGIEFDATDVTNTILKLIADKVKILLPDGQTQVALFSYENGQAVLNTDLIKAQEVVTNGLQANTIDAENATISNLNVTHAEIEESVFKGDIYTPPFVLDEDNIGEMDEEDPTKYKYITAITKDVPQWWGGTRRVTYYAVNIGKNGIGYNVQQNTYEVEGASFDVKNVALNEPSTTAEKDKLVGVECNFMYCPKLHEDGKMPVTIYREDKGAYALYEITLKPMAFVKCKYTKYKQTNGSAAYGWVLISYNNCIVPCPVQTLDLDVQGQLNIGKGVSVNVQTVFDARYTIKNTDYIVMVNSSGATTLTLPSSPGSGQVLLLRRILENYTTTVQVGNSSHQILRQRNSYVTSYNWNSGAMIQLVFVYPYWVLNYIQQD